MKTNLYPLLAAALLLLPAATQAQLGTATVNASGNWNSTSTWSSTPAGFVPINGQNGQNWNAIINNGSRTVTVNAATALEGLDFSAGVINGSQTLTLNAASTWTGGNFGNNTTAGTVNFNGGLAITVNGQEIDKHTVNLGGTSSIGNGTIQMKNSGVLANSGTFNVNNSGSLIFNYAAGTIPTVSNSGTINKDGAGTAQVLVNFNNTGTVNVNEGIMNANVGASTGTFDIDAGAEFRTIGTYAMNAGVQVKGAGIFNVSSGATSFSGASSGSTGNLGIAGGTMTFNSGANFSTTGGFTGTSGVLNGGGTATFNGASTWTGGNIGNNTTAGIVNFSGGLAITISSVEIDKHTVNLGGTSSIGNGTIQMKNGGVLANSGTFNINNSGSLIFNYAAGAVPTVSNSGTINKSGAGALTVPGPLFSNTGTINLTEGTFTVSNTVTQLSGSTLTGGTWNVSGGSALTLSTGSNITTIGSAASVTLDGASSTFNRIPTTASTLTTNQGSFTFKNDRDITTASAFSNSGTVSIQDSATTFKIGATGNLAYTQTGGVTAMVGGAFIDPGVFNLNAGELRGTGTIESSVIAGAGANTIAPGLSPGTLTINGSLTLSGTSLLAMEIGGLSLGTLYDHLDVNGVLTLAGLLDLDFIDTFENSVSGADIFYLATADSDILGSFSNVASGSRLGTNSIHSFEVWYGTGSPYGANNLVITSAPEPSRALLLLLGLLGLLMRRRK
jgi:fibronectin-binding autotransporter adhesin